jgi:hypothetical protein
MFPEPVPVCPLCHQTDKSFKVSRLYIEGSAWLSQHATDQCDHLIEVIREYLPDPSTKPAQDQFVNRLKNLLAPPSGEKQVIRQIHPDGMVAFFLIASVVIIYKAISSQPGSVPLILILIAAGFTAYFVFRRTLVSRYNMRKLQGQQEIARIEKAISRWMRTYFCARDQCVYDPTNGQNASLEQLKDFFYEN